MKFSLISQILAISELCGAIQIRQTEIDNDVSGFTIESSTFSEETGYSKTGGDNVI